MKFNFYVCIDFNLQVHVRVTQFVSWDGVS